MTLINEFSARLEFTVIDCPHCGIQFAITKDFEKRKREDHETFYCPRGHSQYFPQENEKERLKRQLKDNPRTLLRKNGKGKLGSRIHPEDQRRMDFFRDLARGIRNPTRENISQIASYTEPFDPLMSPFAHREAAALELPNVVVVRTLSKAHGLAGVRVGYALGRPDTIRWLRAAGNPYAVSGPGLELALGCLQRPARTSAAVERVRTEREELRREIMESIRESLEDD